MKKIPLNLAFMAASMTVTCTPLIADIRIEAVGVAPTRLKHCPSTTSLTVPDFHQYKVFGHFSTLTLGDSPVATNESKQISSERKNAWNRLILDIGTRDKPIDLFQSSSKRSATTGTILTQYKRALAVDWSKITQKPFVQIQGNTRNPSGSVILCVDFIPVPPRPVGQIILQGAPPRSGDKIPISWTVER